MTDNKRDLGRATPLQATESDFMSIIVSELEIKGSKVSEEKVDRGSFYFPYALLTDNQFEEFYTLWFKLDFENRLGYPPTQDSIKFALEKFLPIYQKQREEYSSK